MTSVEFLDAATELEWEAVLGEAQENFIYHSIGYRNALIKILPSAEPVYLCAREGGRVVGLMPAFVSESRVGAVLNALPFYGSHGQPIISKHASDPVAVRASLVGATLEVARSRAALSATLIGHPLIGSDNDLRKLWQTDIDDQRIGQITDLHGLKGAADSADILMQMCHSKTRNMIRKGFKGGFSISWRADPGILPALHAMHSENMAAIGGLAKPLGVFSALATSLAPDTGWRVWVCERDGRIAAALLCLYYNATVEYFTPAIAADYRSEQPSSALIFGAILDAAARGYTYWNWGGTWTSQDGVFQFKSRWGARAIDYKYYTRVLDERVLDFTREQLAEAFPYFFVVPYSRLRTQQS